MVWQERKERVSSGRASQICNVCKEKADVYMYIQSVQRQNHVMGATVTKKQVSHFGLCHGTHEYLTMIFYTKTYSSHMTPFKPKCSRR